MAESADPARTYRPDIDGLRAVAILYYSLKDQLCNAQGCMTRVGETLPEDLIVYDDGHLMTAGASNVVDSGLGQRIDSLLDEKN